MKRALVSFFCLSMAVFFGLGCNPADEGIPADHFEVQFSGDMSSSRKFGIGKDAGSLVVDPGYFADNTTTGFYHAPADSYSIYDTNTFDADWRLLQEYSFEAQKKYSIHGSGMNSYEVSELP